jgi:uncharacterized protein
MPVPGAVTPPSMRTLILAALAVLATAGSPARALAGDRGLVDTTQSPHALIYMPDIGDARWTGGLWQDRFQVCREVMIPHMWDLLSNPATSHSWQHFLMAAGELPLPDHPPEGPPFADGDFFKWFEAAAQMYGMTHDPALARLMDRIVAVVARAQRPDGYLGTFATIEQMQGHTDVRPFAEKDDFETYNLGHLMTAACVYYRTTGKTTLLDVAKKSADYLVHLCQVDPLLLARADVCPTHYLGVVEMYRTTRDPRYLWLARRLIQIRDLVHGTDQNQDRVAFEDIDKAVGHATRANYLYAGAADLVAETGNPVYLRTLRTIARDVYATKLYITGGTGALYDGASPDGGSDFNAIQPVHQAYGRDYQLPNLTAYCEGCATVAYSLWNWRMLADTGSERYADLFEQSFYNALLADISLDGKDYFYVNTLRKLKNFDWPLRWSRQRQPNIENSFCCPPNTVRTIAESPDYIYALSKDCVWVNLYGSSSLDTRWLDGSRIRLHQATDYPWSSRIRLVIDQAPDHPVTLKLRIPGWTHAGQPSLTVDGAAWSGRLAPGTYADVTRVWRSGDTLDLDLAFKPELWQANPLVDDTLGQVAVKCGPLVYCAESNDLPAGIRLEDVAIELGKAPRPFTRTPETIAGQPLVALTTPAVAVVRPDWTKNELYRDAAEVRLEPFPLTLIPYFAWDNRGDTEMTVWLPLH